MEGVFLGAKKKAPYASGNINHSSTFFAKAKYVYECTLLVNQGFEIFQKCIFQFRSTI